jgi:hypothetical protein
LIFTNQYKEESVKEKQYLGRKFGVIIAVAVFLMLVVAQGTVLVAIGKLDSLDWKDIATLGITNAVTAAGTQTRSRRRRS